jgi:hypothetical protein
MWRCTVHTSFFFLVYCHWQKGRSLRLSVSRMRGAAPVVVLVGCLFLLPHAFFFFFPLLPLLNLVGDGFEELGLEAIEKGDERNWA